MDQNNSWRSQLSLVVSMCLHAGAIALIALAPTLANDFHGNNGADKVELTVTEAPIQTPAPVAVQPAPVPTPVVQPTPAPKPIAVAPTPKPKKVAIQKKAAPKIEAPRKSIEPQPVIEAQNNDSPVEEKVVESKSEVKSEPVDEAVTEKQPEEKQPEPKQEEVAPVAAVATQPPVKEEPAAQQQQQQPVAAAQAQQAPAEKIADTKTSSSGSPDAVAPTPAGVTQNYLGLRQQAGNKPPVYSREMRMNKLQGSGQLVYMVNKDGSVSDLKVTKSTGAPELDQAAIDAFSKYKFVPGQEGYTVHNFEFNLKGPAVSDTGRLRTTMNR